MKNLSNWRSVRVLEGRLERELRQRHSLRLHGLCIGSLTLGMMWAVSHLQMVMGVDSLALRYLITLGAGYLAYLLVLRGWAALLVNQRAESGKADGNWGDLLDVPGNLPSGAVVVIPVVAIFLVGAAILFGAGSLLLLFFGWEVLLTVAVELAFSYVSARAAVRVVREGWVSAAVRLTWKPMLGALACGVLLGATIDHFIPAANSLPQAIKLIGQRDAR
jgi:hypothetical protein